MRKILCAECGNLHGNHWLDWRVCFKNVYNETNAITYMVQYATDEIEIESIRYSWKADELAEHLFEWLTENQDWNGFIDYSNEQFISFHEGYCEYNDIEDENIIADWKTHRKDLVDEIA
jgi:hypothetical protein